MVSFAALSFVRYETLAIGRPLAVASFVGSSSHSRKIPQCGAMSREREPVLLDLFASLTDCLCDEFAFFEERWESF
jgi:hypothetical protein